MDPQRDAAAAGAGKKEASARSTKNNIRGLKKFKSLLFDSDESTGAMRVFHGMVSRQPRLRVGLTTPDATVVPEGQTLEGNLGAMSDRDVTERTAALVALYYEWNTRAFVKLPMRDTMGLLLRLGREKESHLLDFSNQEHYRAFGANDAAAAAAALGAANDGDGAAPTAAPEVDLADVAVGAEDAAAGRPDEAMYDELLQGADDGGFGGPNGGVGLGMGLGFGMGDGPDFDESELFIEP